MTLEEMVEKLAEVTGRDPEQHGRYYTAYCPVHENDGQKHEPSLQVNEKDNGWLWLTCHSGCSQDAILQALDLENSDLNTRGKDFGQPLATYVYVDEWGNELFQVLKYAKPNGGKKFLQRHLEEGEWVWNLDDVRRVPYHLPQLIEAVSKGKTILIPEGEKDVEAWEAQGQAATCNPGGAGGWLDSFSDYLIGADVLIIADRDEAGRMHAAKVRDSLTGRAEHIWIVQARSGNDSSEHIEAGYGVNDLQIYRERFRRGRITSRQMAELAVEDLTLQPEDIPGYRLWNEVPLLFRQGRTYALGAYTGDGKTSSALQAFRKLSSEHVRVGYFSLEMPERDLRNKLIAHRGEIPLGVLEQPWQIPGNPTWHEAYKNAAEEISGWDSDVIFRSNVTAEEIRDMCTDYGYEVIFVDHIHRSSWGRERRQLEEQVNILTNISLEQNVMVVLLCQLRKYARGPQAEAFPMPTIQDFRETSMLGDDASMALGIWRQRDETGMKYMGPTAVILFKNRHTTGHGDQAGNQWYMNFDVARGMFLPEATWSPPTQE